MSLPPGAPTRATLHAEFNPSPRSYSPPSTATPPLCELSSAFPPPPQGYRHVEPRRLDVPQLRRVGRARGRGGACEAEGRGHPGEELQGEPVQAAVAEVLKIVVEVVVVEGRRVGRLLLRQFTVIYHLGL